MVRGLGEKLQEMFDRSGRAGSPLVPRLIGERENTAHRIVVVDAVLHFSPAHLGDTEFFLQRLLEKGKLLLRSDAVRSLELLNRPHHVPLITIELGQLMMQFHSRPVITLGRRERFQMSQVV